MRLALVAFVFFPAVAVADPHPMSSGAAPEPTTDAQVAMTAETLAIALELRAATVNAAVTLVNQGPSTTLVVGFPCATGDDAGQIDVPCKVPLAVTVDGKPVRLTRDKAGKQQSHWVWKMKLADAETVELVVKYRAPLINDRYSVPAYGMGLFTYRLTTGARWAGPIGKLRITLDHMQDALLFVSPAGYRREAGRITWSFDDYEPTEEVIILPHPGAAGRLAQAIGGKTAAELRRRLDAGDYKKADVVQAIELMKDPRPWGEEWPKTISPLGGVPVPPKDAIAAVTAESIKLLEEVAARAKR